LIFRRQRRDELVINLTPLIDVVFLLLIFFMVSTSFTSETQLAIDLPEAEGSPASSTKRRLELTIASDGTFTLNGNAIAAQAAALRSALRDAVGDRRDTPLTIAADGDAPHRYVVMALDVANGLGLKRLTIAAQTPSSNYDSGNGSG